MQQWFFQGNGTQAPENSVNGNVYGKKILPLVALLVNKRIVRGKKLLNFSRTTRNTFFFKRTRTNDLYFRWRIWSDRYDQNWAVNQDYFLFQCDKKCPKFEFVSAGVSLKRSSVCKAIDFYMIRNPVNRFWILPRAQIGNFGMLGLYYLFKFGKAKRTSLV